MEISFYYHIEEYISIQWIQQKPLGENSNESFSLSSSHNCFFYVLAITPDWWATDEVVGLNTGILGFENKGLVN